MSASNSIGLIIHYRLLVTLQQEVHKSTEEPMNKKAPGPDDMPNEMIKYKKLVLTKALTTLFQKTVSMQEIYDV